MPKDISGVPPVKIHLPPGESESFPYLQRINKSISNKATTQGNKELVDSLKRNLSDLFSEKTDQLIGELILHPEEDKAYLELGQRLKELDRQVFNEMKGTISSIRMIASFLRKGEVDKLNAYTHKISHSKDYYSHIPRSTVLHFSKLRLPENLKHVRAIKNETLRSAVMAELINRDRVSLHELMITKEELYAMAPFLTYLSSRQTPDYFRTKKWTSNEIEDFLKKCSELKTLKISSPLLRTIPKLENCEILDCSNCINLTSIKSQPKVTEINFRKCNNLRLVDDLPLCRKITGEENDELRLLPDRLPSCIIFNIQNSERLAELPRLDRCEQFNCNNLTALIQLPELPAAQIVECVNCPVTALPELPNCRSLDCSLCEALNELPELILCTQLTTDGCPQLTNDPARIRIETAFGQIDDGLIEISILQLNSNPLKILLDLSPYLKNGQLPRIRYREKDDSISEGMDAGGLRNNLVSRLIESLVSNANKYGQLSFIQEDGLTPVIDKHSENYRDQIKGFKALGDLFAVCLERGYLTGNVFNPNLFKMIQSLSYEEVSGWPEEIQDLPQETRLTLKSSATEGQEALKKIFELIAKDPLELTTDEYETLKQSYENSGESPEDGIDLKEPSENNKKFVIEKMQESLSKIMKDVELPAAIIAKQMVTHCESHEKWEEWCDGALSLQEKIEGVLTKDSVLEAIVWQSNLAEEIWKPTEAFARRWIEEASNEDLKKLIFTVTGFYSMNTSLDDDKKLKFQFFNRDPLQLPVVHACFSSIEIPTTYPDYKTFKIKLEYLINQSTNKDHSGFEVK